MGTRRSLLGIIAVMLVGCIGTAPATPMPAATGTSVTPSTTPSATSGPDASLASQSDVPTTEPVASAAPGTAPIGPTEIAVVVSITDGDTIRIDRGFGSERLRYIGINTPEVGDPGGGEATAANAALVEGQEVVLERDVSETDRFDRLLRYVWIRDGAGWVFVNLELVRQGFAQAATYPPDVRYAELLLAAQRTAREAGVGLWAPTEPTDPPDGDDPGGGCHPPYDPCLPIVDDLNCPDVRALGLAPVDVIGPDEYRLDADHDGIGCD